MPLDMFGSFSQTREKRPTPQRKRKRVPRERHKSESGRGTRLVKIVTTTERVHKDIKGNTQGKSKETLSQAKRNQLLKAMRASLKSPNTPPQLKAGLRRKIAEWSR